MATEIEMKLSVPSHEVMDQILQDPQLTQYMRDEPETRHMRSTYYDTEDGALCARRWTLRLRDEGGTPVVAMKTPNANAGTGLYTRHEWQCRAARPEEAVPRLVEQGAPAALMQLTQGKRLEAICRAEFDRRSTCLYLPDGVRIEMAADEGVLSGGGNEQPLRELELELLFGESEALPPISRRLIETYGLTEEPQSKFQRAIALCRARTENPAE